MTAPFDLQCTGIVLDFFVYPKKGQGRARSKTCGSAELGRMLRLAVLPREAQHVRELLRPMAEQIDVTCR